MTEDPKQPVTPSVDNTNQQAIVADQGAKGAEGEKGTPTTPDPKTYSEKEWGDLTAQHAEAVKQMQAGHTGTVKEMRGQIAELNRKIREGEDSEFLKAVKGAEVEGGVEVAQKLISLRDSLEERVRTMDEREETWKQGEPERLKTLMGNAANVLIKEHDLDSSAKAELLKAETPQGMETMALKMALEKVRTGAKDPVVTDSGLGSGKGTDVNKMTPSEQIAEGIKQQEAKKRAR